MCHSLILCAVLCCAVLCCAVLCCAVLCCAALCCAVLCCDYVSLEERQMLPPFSPYLSPSFLLTVSKFHFLDYPSPNGCLNVGVRLSRQLGRRPHASVHAQDRYKSTSTSTPQSENPAEGFVFKSFSLGPTNSALAPHTYMCVALKCSAASTAIKMDASSQGDWNTLRTFYMENASILLNIFSYILNTCFFLLVLTIEASIDE